MVKENKQPRPGRAAWTPSDGQRALVRQMTADGAGHEAVADALQISVPTLRKYCSEELRDHMGAHNLFAVAGHEPPAVAPATPRQKRPGVGGRKRYQPTLQDRRLVEDLTASGMKVSSIARELGVTEPTLRKHFRTELDNGLESKRAKAVKALFKAVDRGSIPAIKLAFEMMDKASLGELSRSLGQGASVVAAPEAERAAPLGKKAQADQDAQRVVEKGEWAGLLSDEQPLPN